MTFNNRSALAIVVWVSLGIILLVISGLAVYASGDPSYCPSCPEYWKQQP